MIRLLRGKKRSNKVRRSVELEGLEPRCLLSGFTPTTIVGHQLTATITGGTGVYATSGTYVLAFSSSSLNYYELGQTGGFTDAFGTYTYAQASGTTATIALQDAALPGVLANDSLLYSSGSGGVFTISSIDGTQTGSFTTTADPAGTAQSAIPGAKVTFTVNSSKGNFAGISSGAVTTNSSGSGETTVTQPGGASVVGTYTYGTSSVTTAVLSVAGSGAAAYDMTFASNTAGSFVVKDPSTDSWELGTFVVTPAPNVAPTGFFDSATGTLLTGWAFDFNSQSNPASVQISIDGSVFTTFAATNYRADLQGPVGSTNHGFSYTLPIALAFGAHTATVSVVDTTSGALVSLGSRVFQTQPSLFDEAWYDASNPDVEAAIVSGAMPSGWFHYLHYGQQEGRDPSAYFDENYYRTANPDVNAAILAGSFQSGFDHYIRYGQAEATRNPTPYFNEQYYYTNNSDVVAAVSGGAFTSGYQHFLLYGSLENRQPATTFNPTIYLQKNADVATAVTSHAVRSAWDHWMLYGRFEGRMAT